MPVEVIYLLIGFALGVLIRYIFDWLDLFNQALANKQTLKASYMQREMDELNPQQEQYEIKESCIGFHAPSESEEIYEEECRSRVGFIK